MEMEEERERRGEREREGGGKRENERESGKTRGRRNNGTPRFVSFRTWGMTAGEVGHSEYPGLEVKLKDVAWTHGPCMIIYI